MSNTTSRPDPYVRRNPNDLIQSNDWNEIQVRAREELRAHTHKGGADGSLIPREGLAANAVDGTKIDPASEVRVARLQVDTQLRVRDRDVFADITSLLSRVTDLETRVSELTTRMTSVEQRATALESGKVNRAGDTIQGRLSVQGDLVTTRVGIGSAQPTLPARLSLGTDSANTKIALHDNPTDLYGLGIQSGQFRLHLGNTSARFTFLDAAAGNELLNLQGDGRAIFRGPLQPSLGNDANSGIHFPIPPVLVALPPLLPGQPPRLVRRDGDEGFIRCYTDTSETTKLLIGVKNDANDTIGFWQADAERMTVTSQGLELRGEGATLELGAGAANKDAESGKIAFRRWTQALDIVGVGPTWQQRRITFHSQGGSEFLGNVTIKGVTGELALRMEGTGDRLVTHWVRNNALLWDVGVGTDSGNEHFWWGDFTAYRMILERGTGNLRITGRLISASSKLFRIDHPLDPRGQHLSHASLEGPEAGVYYRGEARLVDGVARVELPAYFEALVRKEDRTVQLTPKLEGKGPVSALAASAVEEGTFTVRAIDRNNPSQAFYWEVKAVRGDIERLEVETPKERR